MKICLINPFSKPAAVRQYNLAKAMASQGNEVTLVLPKFDKYSDYEEVIIKPSKNLKIIHPFQIKSKIMEISMFFYFLSLLKTVKNQNFDIVHGFRPTPFSGYMAYKVSKKNKIPFVLEMGDVEWETMKYLKIHPTYRVKIVKWLETFLIGKSDGLTTMSPTLSKYFEKMYKKSVKTVTSGIDSQKFSPQNKDPKLRTEFEKKTGKKRLMIYVGKLDKSNHVRDLIKVLSKIEEIGLVIVGDGKGKQALIDLAKELKVLDRCFFVGRINHDEIPKYLNCADILAAPFAKDTVGADFILNLKVLEYMGMEKPIVLSKIGILKDFLKDCAYFYEPENLDSFSEQLKNILNDKNGANLVAKKARKKILNYDWKILAKEMVSYYQSIIEK